MPFFHPATRKPDWWFLRQLQEGNPISLIEAHGICEQCGSDLPNHEWLQIEPTGDRLHVVVACSWANEVDPDINQAIEIAAALPF